MKLSTNLVHELVVVVVDFSQDTPLEIFGGHLQIKNLFYCLVIGINGVLGWFRSFPVKKCFYCLKFEEYFAC